MLVPGIVSSNGMLTIDLVRLRQCRAVSVDGCIPGDADAWIGTGVQVIDAVEVSASATATSDNGVVVRGTWSASVAYECNRCLDTLSVTFQRPLALVFVAAGDMEALDPDVRTIDAGHAMLDLTEALREEVLLEVPRYHAPQELDDGCCARCGEKTEKYTTVQEASAREIDPRWQALLRTQIDSDAR